MPDIIIRTATGSSSPNLNHKISNLTPRRNARLSSLHENLEWQKITSEISFAKQSQVLKDKEIETTTKYQEDHHI
jgi:hypothetical protein